jgi:hypothetical protein
MITSVKAETQKRMNWQAASTLCQNKGTGWRLPTLNELMCMDHNYKTLPDTIHAGDAFWSASNDQDGNERFYAVLVGGGGGALLEDLPDLHYVKCVK